MGREVTMPTLDPTDAPPGYVAVHEISGCYDCHIKLGSAPCFAKACTASNRKDAHNVIFKAISDMTDAETIARLRLALAESEAERKRMAEAAHYQDKDQAAAIRDEIRREYDANLRAMELRALEAEAKLLRLRSDMAGLLGVRL